MDKSTRKYNHHITFSYYDPLGRRMISEISIKSNSIIISTEEYERARNEAIKDFKKYMPYEKITAILQAYVVTKQ